MSWPHTFIPLDPNELDIETPSPTPPETEKVKGGEQTTTPEIIIETKKLPIPLWSIIALSIIAAIIFFGGIVYFFIK